MPAPEDLAQMELFYLVRLLEGLLPGGAPLGERGPAARERIRLRPSTSLGFPTAEVAKLDMQADGRALVTTNLAGLYGSGSPLPRSYPHQLLLHEDDEPQTRQFLDLLIHHRLFSLLYRAWKRHRYEQAFVAGGGDALSRSLLDMLGVSPEATAESLGIAPTRLLRYLGLLLVRTRPIAGLVTLLQEELGLPIHIQQAPARTLRLPAQHWFRLSSDRRRAGKLGRDVIVGASRIDRQSALRLHIGPVRFHTLQQLRSGAPLHRRLTALARLYLRQPLDLELYILVPAREVARTRLGDADTSQLGGVSSMGPPQKDPVLFVIQTSVLPHQRAPCAPASTPSPAEVSSCSSSSTAPCSSD